MTNEDYKCKDCKDTGKIPLLISEVECDCVKQSKKDKDFKYFLIQVLPEKQSDECPNVFNW